MDISAAPFEVKFADKGAPGEFEGYGAFFDNVDSHEDKIAAGAFADTLLERKAQGRGNPPMRIMHGGSLFGGDATPAGVWKVVEEDSRGLHVKGKISGAETTERGRHNLELVRDGALKGLSVGWSQRPNGTVLGTKAGEPKRLLKSVNLHEISLVDEPSNALSVITGIKALHQANVSGAATSIAAAIAMHDKTMSGYGYGGGGSAKNAALLMDHLRDAHQALTGSRAPHGVEGWTKSMSAGELIESVKSIFGLSDQEARGFAEVALHAPGDGLDDETKAALAGFDSFSLPTFG